MKKKILVFTGSRADFGILKPLILRIKREKLLKLFLFAGPHHFQKKTGLTGKEIKKNKLKIDYSQKYLFKNLNEKEILKYCGVSLISFSEIFNKNKPDLIILLGDRYEVFIFCIVAFFFNIPVAHIHGGEITSGAIDDALRHSITKMSNIHFVCHKDYKKRVIQLGENPKTVFNFGSLALETLKNKNILEKKVLFKKYKIPTDKKTILVTFHPETKSKIFIKNQIKILLNSIKRINESFIIFTNNNFDTFGNYFIQEISNFCKKNVNSKIIKSLGIDEYHNFVFNVDLVLGNSSSGVIEVPMLKTPTLNIGERQKGRVFSKSVFQVDLNSRLISKKINFIFNKKGKNTFENKFYKKDTSLNMIREIKKFIFKNNKNTKTFYDLKR